MYILISCVPERLMARELSFPRLEAKPGGARVRPSARSEKPLSPAATVASTEGGKQGVASVRQLHRGRPSTTLRLPVRLSSACGGGSTPDDDDKPAPAAQESLKSQKPT